MKCIIVFKSTIEFTYSDTVTEEPIDGKLPTDTLAYDTIERFVTWIEQGSTDNSPAYSSLPWEIVGLQLFNFLFEGNSSIKKAFVSLLEVYRDSRLTDQNRKVVLELKFADAAARLENIPWEFLRVPALNGEKESFWAQTGNGFILNRLTYGTNPVPLAAPSRILRVLVVGCLSANQKRGEEERIVKEIRKLHENQRISLRYLLSDKNEKEQKPALENIQREVSTFQPHVFLFVGQAKEGKLGLSQKTEASTSLHDTVLPEIRWINGDEMVSIFDKQVPAVSFFLPTASELKKVQDTSESSMWKKLSLKLPVLGCFRYEIAIEDKIQFLRTFLCELAEGRHIGESVKSGIQEIANSVHYERVRWGSKSFAAPAFYFHPNADQSLVDIAGEEKNVIPKSNKDKISCPLCGYFIQKGQNRCFNISCRHRLVDCPVYATHGICGNCSYGTGTVELLPRMMISEERSKKTLTPLAVGRIASIAGTTSIPTVLPDPLEVESPGTQS